MRAAERRWDMPVSVNDTGHRGAPTDCCRMCSVSDQCRAVQKNKQCCVKPPATRHGLQSVSVTVSSDKAFEANLKRMQGLPHKNASGRGKYTCMHKPVPRSSSVGHALLAAVAVRAVRGRLQSREELMQGRSAGWRPEGEPQSPGTR